MNIEGIAPKNVPATAETSKKPYISINKLAEYMTADSIRRRQIIAALKKDSDFTKTYYSEVKNSFGGYIKSGYDTDLLNTVVDRIKAKTAATDWDKADNENSILALEGLMNIELPDLSGYEFIADMGIKSVLLSDVTVTIKPELYLKNKANGKYGAIKSHIAKTPANRLNHENREYAATLLKYGFIDSGIDEKAIDSGACISIDLFLESYSVAPGAYRRKLAALEASCEEIALRWDKA